MASFTTLRKHVLSRISPTFAEAKAEKDFAAGLVKRLEKQLPYGVRVLFVGSAARDTGLHGDNDLDLFACFPKKFSKEEIVAATIKATKKAISAKWVMHYAEHPYLKARIGEFEVEVIPCFEISPHDELKSAVDRSPLHALYLQEHLTPAQKQDVRLFKQFLKNAGLYGAELRVAGFSGVLCEYLVLNYRSFLGVVEAASKWRVGEVIDLEGHYAGVKPPFDTPLVLIDAVDKKRNVAAVLSLINFSKFVSLCNAFARKPTHDFFFHKPRAFSSIEVAKLIKKRGTLALLVSLKAPDVVEDVLYPQIQKTLSSFSSHLVKERFSLASSAYFTDERCNRIFFLLEFSSPTRSSVQKIRGPPAGMHESIALFAKSHKNALRGLFVEGENVFVEEFVTETSAIAVTKNFLSRPTSFGAASHLLAPLKKSSLLILPQKLASLPKSVIGELGNHFSKREFWL